MTKKQENKTKPYLDDFDELKPFYGQLSHQEIDLVKDVIKNFLSAKPKFKK